MGFNGKIKIPPKAYTEYNLIQDNYAILFSGSKASGGFGLSSPRLLGESVMKKALAQQDTKYKIKEGEISNGCSRKYCWVKILGDKSIILAKETLEIFGIDYNDYLLTARGSGLAIGFVAKGLIFEEAKNYNNIKVFE
ncbi:MAG: hypothetical protein ACFFBH_11950 [Promethearchaeota archaeon]